ncbi:MAG: hypothetical protein V1659_01745 [Candidatus Woesearchaeota archaeon]
MKEKDAMRDAYLRIMTELAASLVGPLGLSFNRVTAAESRDSVIGNVGTLVYRPPYNIDHLFVDLMLPTYTDVAGINLVSFRTAVRFHPGRLFNICGDIDAVTQMLARAKRYSQAFTDANFELIEEAVSHPYDLGNSLFENSFEISIGNDPNKLDRPNSFFYTCFERTIRNTARALHACDNRLTPEDKLARMTSPEREI